MAMQASIITSNRQQVTGNDYNFPVIQSEYNFPSQGQYANFNLVPQPQYNLYNVTAQYSIDAPQCHTCMVTTSMETNPSKA